MGADSLAVHLRSEQSVGYRIQYTGEYVLRYGLVLLGASLWSLGEALRAKRARA